MGISPECLQRYQTTIDRAEQWIRDHLDQLLAMDDIQGYYKAPYAWACLGDMQMAGLYRKLFAERFLQPDGDFRSAPDSKGFYKFHCTVENQYIYSNGWIISGLQKLGAFDLANKALEFIFRFQHPSCGGFFNTFDPATGVMGSHLLDSSSTSSAGMAAIFCGRLDEARRAGDFLLKLFDLQPEPDKYFYSCMVAADGTLFTDVFGNDDQWAGDGRKQKCLSAATDGAAELTWLIGKPTKFLSRLYTATGEQKYLDGSIWAFDFFHKLQDNAWTNYASCKTMWAGAELYRITGEQRFADTAMRILDFYTESQSPDGAWVHKLWYEQDDDQSLEWFADITYEYIGEISDAICDLASA